MEAGVKCGFVSACTQSALLGRPSCAVPALSSPCGSQLRSLPPLRSRYEGLASFCGGGSSVSRLRETSRVQLVGRRRSGLECRADLSDVTELAPVTAAVYGASLLGGGLFAFTKTGSKGSLGGGLVGGIALGVAFFLMQVPETKDLGQAIGFGSAVLFAAIFGIRLAATKKIMPAGALLIVSTVASVIFSIAYLQTRLPGPTLQASEAVPVEASSML